MVYSNEIDFFLVLQRNGTYFFFKVNLDIVLEVHIILLYKYIYLIAKREFVEVISTEKNNLETKQKSFRETYAIPFVENAMFSAHRTSCIVTM